MRKNQTPGCNINIQIERTNDGKDAVVWRINPDGTDLRKSEDALAEYRRRFHPDWAAGNPSRLSPNWKN